MRDNPKQEVNRVGIRMSQVRFSSESIGSKLDYQRLLMKNHHHQQRRPEKKPEGCGTTTTTPIYFDTTNFLSSQYGRCYSLTGEDIVRGMGVVLHRSQMFGSHMGKLPCNQLSCFSYLNVPDPNPTEN